MAKQIVLINRHVIASNKKHGRQDPPISVRNGKHGKPWYVSELVIDRPAKLIYNPENPLKCGATVWIEIDEEE